MDEEGLNPVGFHSTRHPGRPVCQKLKIQILSKFFAGPLEGVHLSGGGGLINRSIDNRSILSDRSTLRPTIVLGRVLSLLLRPFVDPRRYFQFHGHYFLHVLLNLFLRHIYPHKTGICPEGRDQIGVQSDADVVPNLAVIIQRQKQLGLKK